MKDNDQTANLGALIDAGVRSFKIEGRYKDMSYVKNITAHYRQMLDAIIDERSDLARASFGRTEHFFVPSTEKTFHRGSTDYFVNARKGDIGAFDSPKFVGLPVGEVLKVIRDIAKEGITMIIVTHEMSFASDAANRVIFMAGGVVVEEGKPDEIFSHPREERTRQFLERVLPKWSYTI